MAIHEPRDAFDVTRLANAEEMWFYGVHSNVGGSYVDTGLSDIALLWMIKNGINSGLRFDMSTNKLGFNIQPNIWGELRDPREPIYGQIKRKILSSDKIHPSALERMWIENK